MKLKQTLTDKNQILEVHIIKNKFSQKTQSDTYTLRSISTHTKK